MSRLLLNVSLLLLVAPFAATAQEPKDVFTSVAEAEKNPDFAIQGEYVASDAATGNKAAQVVARGNGVFRVVLYNGGLPGAGWDRKAPQILEGEESEDVVDLLETMKLEKVSRQSPTLGAKPPAGAVVLFDGTEQALKDHWLDNAKMTDDGLLIQGTMTKDKFRDFTIHVEFQTSFMPFAQGQSRANSGIYYQGRYETQVLDSFGLEGKNNETGGIYEIRDPDVNMCLPPLSWQTYDVDFTAARWNDKGEKTANVKMTVRLNGVIVQPDVEVPRTTRAAPLPESPESGPIYIQDHGNPIRFRNIWILPRDAEQEARRPRIPGYERFLALSDNDGDAGRLLVGELGCVNCHEVNDAVEQALLTKQAPILTNIAQRVRPDWMVQFLANPHETKAGTTMPDPFAGWSNDERMSAVQALANFLASGGQPAERTADREAMARGERLFHQVGCVACHTPRNGTSVREATTVPLPDVAAKYSMPAMIEFLKNPHAVRPSGRMPSLNLEQKEIEDLASYLTSGATRDLPKNVHFAAYHGSWESLPNFAELTPVDEGVCSGLDVSVANRSENFGVVYTAFLKLEKKGNYSFWLGSDDGSRLVVDDQEVVSVDGIHPHTTKEGKLELDSGVHRIRVEYFELGGEESVRLELAGPGMPRQDASLLLTTDESGKPIELPKQENPEDGLAFHRDASLVEQGRKLFASIGCANCHEYQQDGKKLTSSLSAPAWSELRSQSGCLSSDVVGTREKPIPNYDLTQGQQRHIAASLASLADNVTMSPEQTVHQTMLTFNCYACHERGGLGGPEPSRNALFETTQHEMGDEGRLPPSLTGVGDKLQDGWLKQILANGANERPYMRTRMPKFGNDVASPLAPAFITLDRKEEGELAEFEDPEIRVKSTGRELVGNSNLACIKCHTFANHPATGIQAISLTGMTRRIRPEWFVRYLYDPAKYRPGTRMPTGFPNGQAVVKDIYDGHPNQQISAVWTYLTDGDKAGIPEGLIARMIELVPEKEPILYRNFIEGLSPRGIAVGTPEKAHFAWDANELCLRLIWHDRFIDASKHWTGRGQGKQVPLGDHILTVEPHFAFAQLASQDAPWPADSIRDRQGYQFEGYSLNDAGQPEFRLKTPFGEVTDFPEPLKKNDKEGNFRRVLTITAADSPENLYFRAGIGDQIEALSDGFQIDGVLTVRVTGGGLPLVRESNGKQELLVPVKVEDGQAKLAQELIW